jgi:hypothetical protein
VPVLVIIAVGGLSLAAWAHRRSSVVLGLLVCATTGLIISPITWVHHMVWVVPVIIWLAAGADRPRWGRWMAAFATVLFVAAPIWWVPTSWRVTTHAPELHQSSWQLLFGNSFLFAMLAFLAGVGVMLVRRSGFSFRKLSPPAFLALELRHRPPAASSRSGAETSPGEGVGPPEPPLTVEAASEDLLAEDLELVGSETASGPAGPLHR